MMVDDFNEFTAVVPSPVERIHLKRYVKNYVEQWVSSASARDVTPLAKKTPLREQVGDYTINSCI